VRNQRQKAPQESHQLQPDGFGLGCRAHLNLQVRGTPGLVDIAGSEAMTNACGVLVAMRQGHSWAPHSINGHAVNVGTVPTAPPPMLLGGKARRQLMLSGWGGGPVVVRGRESRLHGEGVQRDRSLHAEQGGRW
jgi:hypothetical protein